GWTDFGFPVLDGFGSRTNNFTPQFFNPVTARPALPTPGQAARDDVRGVADRFDATRDELKKVVDAAPTNFNKEVKDANARANQQFFNPATARPALPALSQPAPGDGKDNSGQKSDPKAPPGDNSKPPEPGRPGQPDKPAAPAAPDPARRVVIRS